MFYIVKNKDYDKQYRKYIVTPKKTKTQLTVYLKNHFQCIENPKDIDSVGIYVAKDLIKDKENCSIYEINHSANKFIQDFDYVGEKIYVVLDDYGFGTNSNTLRNLLYIIQGIDDEDIISENDNFLYHINAIKSYCDTYGEEELMNIML